MTVFWCGVYNLVDHWICLVTIGAPALPRLILVSREEYIDYRLLRLGFQTVNKLLKLIPPFDVMFLDHPCDSVH